MERCCFPEEGGLVQKPLFGKAGFQGTFLKMAKTGTKRAILTFCAEHSAWNDKLLWE